jgi:hypothetical protein
MSNLNETTIFIDNEHGIASIINKSANEDIIHLDSGIYTNENCLNLKINKKIAIEGENIIINANKKNRVFIINTYGSLNLTNITITNVYAGYGAGINN